MAELHKSQAAWNEFADSLKRIGEKITGVTGARGGREGRSRPAYPQLSDGAVDRVAGAVERVAAEAGTTS